MAVQEGSAKGCLLPLAIATVMAAVGYGVWSAQQGGTDAFAAGGAPYLDALVAGDWGQAAVLDHPVRDLSSDALAAAWTDRQARWGDLSAWTLKVANPGRDADGPFLYVETVLTFDGDGGPVGLNLKLRPHLDTFRVHSASAPARGYGDERVW